MHPSEPLYFLHIPKTAGTSFRSLLESRFAPEEICPIYSPRELFRQTREELEGYRLYRGHLGFTLPAHLSEPPRIITLLREPASLVVSMYHFFRRLPSHPLHPIINGEGLSLEDFLHHDACLAYARNPQTYHLAYHDQVWTARAIALEMGSREDRLRMRREAAFAFNREAPQHLLERACSRLEQLTHVGLADRLPESVSLLTQTLGWPSFPEVPRLNTSPETVAPAELPGQVRDRLEELTQLDAAIYQRGRALFEERLRALKLQRARPALGSVAS